MTYIALCKFIPFWLRFSSFWGNFFKDFFKDLAYYWLAGLYYYLYYYLLLSAKCFYLLKPCFNYIFQVSILSISRKVMEGNDKLKSWKWKVLHKNKKSQAWIKKALFEYFRLKFGKANIIFENNALEFIQIPQIEQNNNDKNNNKK